MKVKFKRAKSILWALGYVGIFYIVSMVIPGLYLAKENGSSYSTISDSLANNMYSLSVISMICAFWTYLIIRIIRRKPEWMFIKSRKTSRMVIVMAVLFAFGCRILVSVDYGVSQNIGVLKNSIEEASLMAPEIITPVQIVVALLASVIIAPLFEEFLFRGLVFQELLLVMRPWAANVIQALLFGVAHGVLFQSLFSFVLGMILGEIYHKTKNLTVSVVCHSVFNASVIFAQTEINLLSGIVMSVLGLLLCAFSFTYIVKSK